MHNLTVGNAGKMGMCFTGLTVSEIKVLFYALTGRTNLKTVRPGNSSCTLLICSNDKWLKNRAHSACTHPKIVHPAAAEMGAGCTLNFRHCLIRAISKVLLMKTKAS